MNVRYEPASLTSDLLASSLESRNARLGSHDMVAVDEAAARAGTNRATIEAWIRGGRCIGLADAEGKCRLPKWQFEPRLWSLIPKLFEALGVREGWALLRFLETPHAALDGATPRVAIERGLPARVLVIAQHEGN